MFRNCLAILVLLTLPIVAMGQLEIAWHTIDGGGALHASDGLSEGVRLSGTIGQSDAAAPMASMTGGDYELAGGFWVAFSTNCFCRGDLNHDGSVDGRDVQHFVECFIAGGGCACAELDHSPGLTADDLTMFVAELISGSPCD